MNAPEMFRITTLAHPWALLLLIGVVALFLFEAFARAPGVLRISTGETLERIRRRAGGAWMRLPALLRAFGLSFLVLALAGPLTGIQLRRDRADVVDIMLCVDVSGSMQQPDFFLGGQPRDRLYVTKAAVLDFIESRKERAGDRYGLDRLGLILYARFAWTQCPLTLDYAVLEHELDRAAIVTDRRRDGTAIGSAIGLAVRRLSQSEAASKVIILLTDGLNNYGQLDPVTAAQVAAQYGIRVYTIGAGATEDRPAADPRWPGMRTQAIDEEMLKKIAATTRGHYYRVTDTASLHNAYAEINQLEATEIDVGVYYEYKEAFLPFAAAGAFALLVSVLVRRRWFEVIP